MGGLGIRGRGVCKEGGGISTIAICGASTTLNVAYNPQCQPFIIRLSSAQFTGQPTDWLTECLNDWVTDWLSNWQLKEGERQTEIGVMNSMRNKWVKPEPRGWKLSRKVRASGSGGVWKKTSLTYPKWVDWNRYFLRFEVEWYMFCNDKWLINECMYIYIFKWKCGLYIRPF